MDKIPSNRWLFMAETWRFFTTFLMEHLADIEKVAQDPSFSKADLVEYIQYDSAQKGASFDLLCHYHSALDDEGEFSSDEAIAQVLAHIQAYNEISEEGARDWQIPDVLPRTEEEDEV